MEGSVTSTFPKSNLKKPPDKATEHSYVRFSEAPIDFSGEYDDDDEECSTTTCSAKYEVPAVHDISQQDAIVHDTFIDQAQDSIKIQDAANKCREKSKMESKIQHQLQRNKKRHLRKDLINFVDTSIAPISVSIDDAINEPLVLQDDYMYNYIKLNHSDILSDIEVLDMQQVISDSNLTESLFEDDQIRENIIDTPVTNVLPTTGKPVSYKEIADEEVNVSTNVIALNNIDLNTHAGFYMNQSGDLVYDTKLEAIGDNLIYLNNVENLGGTFC